ncbi:MAG: hypothetical protein RLZZ568_916, partial [Cyanobacteriota bacterium]
MTTNPPPSSDNTGMMAKAGRWLRKPSTLGIVGGIVLAGTGLYLGGQQLAYRQASPFLASELSRLLGRPVQLGDVKAVGFFQIVFGSSTMPATALDPTTIALEAIEVSANPWLFLVGQPLEIETTLVRPRLTLKQDKAGKWTTFELPKGEGKFELPVDIDAKVTLQAAQISLLPYGLPRPLVVTADGQVSYQYLRQDESQSIGYDLDIALASSQITAKGETAITTGKSETSIRIDRLDLPQLARLLPPSPVKVQSGTVAGEVNASLPSWTQIGALQTLGNLKLSQLQARLDQVQAPLKADFKLNLVGRKLIVEQGRFELGPLKTEVQGAIAWNEGYNLSAITNAVEAKTFSQTLNLNLPVAVDGRIKAQLQVRGPLANPQLQGRLDNVGPVRVDQVVMDTFRTDFRADLDTLTVPHFRVQPQTGGTIQGRAQLNWQLRHLLTPAKAPPWRWQTIPIQAQLTGAIATQPLLATYHIQPEQVNIGNLNFAAQATGTLSAPQANLEWRTDQSSRLTGVTLATRGQANLVDQQFTLKDVEIRSNDGNVRIAGQGNLRQNRWQLQATTQQFPLTPFIQAVCQLETTPACPTALRQKPLTITAGRLELMGELTPIDPSRWQGSGQLQFRSQTETAQIATRLEGGQLQTNLVARHLAVNPYVPQLTTPITLDQFTAQAQLPLRPLLTGQFPLQQLSGHSQLRASINHQPVTATTHISQGQLETQATLGNISLNALAPQLPVPALVDQGKISVAANMSDLLQPQPDLRRLEAIATVALTVAGGEVTSVSRLDNLAWRSQITAQNLALPAPDSPAIEDLTPINAQVSLAGHLKGLFSPSGQWGSFPITVQKSQVTSGDQQLTAQGTLVLGNLAQQPELSQVDLALQGDFNLAQLPVNAAIAQLPMAADLKPASLDLVGKTQFVGNLTGQGVTDVKDLQLVGQVTVNQLAINDYAFEPRLTGPLSAQVGQPINLDLQGEVDQLAFNLQPCRGQCFSPYLPTRFRLRQAYNRPDAIIAQGQLNGDRLTVDVDHFPLAILNVRPA